MSEIRVRFAPSPTGHIHVGNARTALFNWLYARNTSGTFVLRIEDTDLERSTVESEMLIYEDLKWLGLTWDEGEGAGGSYGPYRQTERLDIYKECTDKLLNSGDAYYCFCSKEELDAEREKAQKEGRPPLYNEKCRHIPREEAEKRVAAGENAAVRFKVQQPEILVKDLIHGNITFPTNAFGDFIIVRPDGVPIYNYVVVVDDALMKITHVIRGDDHLPNTPKQALIFKALGYEPPLFAHIPMILGPDKSKLSKRHGNTSVEQFRSAGYLPEAMVNFMALLSWTDGTEQEIFTVEELIQKFSLDRVSSSAAVFDFDKLKWMNGMYIRATDIAKITTLCKPYLLVAGFIDDSFDNDRLVKIVASVRDNLEVLGDIVHYTEVYFRSLPEADEDTKAILAMETTKAVLESFLSKLDKDWLTVEEYKAKVKEVQTETGAKGKALFMGIRVGMTGRTKGPELDQFVPIMPVAELKTRLKEMIGRL
mgnify:CR=1 FL=1